MTISFWPCRGLPPFRWKSKPENRGDRSTTVIANSRPARLVRHLATDGFLENVTTDDAIARVLRDRGFEKPSDGEAAIEKAAPPNRIDANPSPEPRSGMSVRRSNTIIVAC